MRNLLCIAVTLLTAASSFAGKTPAHQHPVFGKHFVGNQYHSLNEKTTNSRGGVLHVSYEATTAAHVLSLEKLLGLLSVDCSKEDRIILTLDPSHHAKEELENWLSAVEAGTTIVAGSRFACKSHPNSELEKPLIREVTANGLLFGDPSISEAARTIIIPTAPRSFADVFLGAAIQLKYVPPPKLSQNSSLAAAPPAAGAHVSHARKPLKVNCMFFPCKVGSRKSWDIFNFNYDSSSRGASQSRLTVFERTSSRSSLNSLASLTCVECFAHLTVTVEMQVRFRREWLGLPYVDYMLVKLSGELGISGDLEASSEYEFDLSKRLQVFQGTRLGSISVQIGPVPFTIEASTGFALEGDLTSARRARINMGFDYNLAVSYGVEYRHSWGELRLIKDSSSEFNRHPLEFDLDAPADVRVTLVPSLTFLLYHVMPVTFEVRPFLGADVVVGSESGCSSAKDPHYQMYVGIDLAIVAEKLRLQFWEYEFEFGAPFLPKTFKAALVTKTMLQCKLCSGCISPTAPEVPSGDPDGDLTCPSACMPNFGDGVCDPDCDTPVCGYDGGDCGGGDTACSIATTCVSCQQKPACGWCAFNNQCMTAGAAAASCPAASWLLDDCVAKEAQLSVTSPAAGTTVAAGVPFTVRWAGGLPGGEVFIAYFIGNNFYSGFGFPRGPVPNSGSFVLTLKGGMQSTSNARIAVFSTTQENNNALSDVVSFDGQLHYSEWQTGPWGACSKRCGGGAATRTVACVDMVDQSTSPDSACQGSRPPATAQCNTEACPPACPNVPACQQNACGTCSCRPQQGGGQGEFCGMTMQTPFGSMVVGCDTRGAAYQECCAKQGLVCDDGCFGKAAWLQTGAGSCSKKCGGGLRQLSFSCKGAYNSDPEPITCNDEFCSGADPSGAYPCNVQPCETFAWVLGSWGICSKECGASGRRVRNVTCVSSAGSAVVASKCPQVNKPAADGPCNAFECPEQPLQFLQPATGADIEAGDSVRLVWSGGKADGQVTLTLGSTAGIGSSLVSDKVFQSGVFGLPPGSVAAASSAGLGEYTWTPTETIPSGKYLLRVTSMSLPSNHATSLGPVNVRGKVSYTVQVAVSGGEAQALAGSQLVVVGAAADASFPLPLSELSGSIFSVSTTVLDAGALLDVDCTSGGLVGLQVSVTVSGSGGETLGTFALPSTRSDNCFVVGSDCASCLAAEGCGWCAATGACLPALSEAPVGSFGCSGGLKATCQALAPTAAVPTPGPPSPSRSQPTFLVSPTTSSRDASPSTESSNESGGLIIGISAGVAGAVVIIGGLVYWFCTRRTREKKLLGDVQLSDSIGEYRAPSVHL